MLFRGFISANILSIVQKISLGQLGMVYLKPGVDCSTIVYNMLLRFSLQLVSLPLKYQLLCVV